MHPWQIKEAIASWLILVGACLSGCTTVKVDQVQHQEVSFNHGESVVVIGRRSGSDYETEPELISCIGKVLANEHKGLNVIPEQEFVDSLYPWFEARTAPTQVKGLNRLLDYEKINDVIDAFNVHYIVWVDGNTEKVRGGGSISCGLSPAGVACLGFGTWDNKAEYEASIWDYRTRQLVGKVSSVADGTSYMPAIVVPIPIIAPVQADACKAMANQLGSFFTQE